MKLDLDAWERTANYMLPGSPSREWIDPGTVIALIQWVREAEAEKAMAMQTDRLIHLGDREEIARLSERIAALERVRVAAETFKAAIDHEEAEFGFPFSFDLRAAHRAFVKALK